jgi:hypothetical protein
MSFIKYNDFFRKFNLVKDLSDLPRELSDKIKSEDIRCEIEYRDNYISFQFKSKSLKHVEDWISKNPGSMHIGCLTIEDRVFSYHNHQRTANREYAFIILGEVDKFLSTCQLDEDLIDEIDILESELDVASTNSEEKELINEILSKSRDILKWEHSSDENMGYARKYISKYES